MLCFSAAAHPGTGPTRRPRSTRSRLVHARRPLARDRQIIPEPSRGCRQTARHQQRSQRRALARRRTAPRSSGVTPPLRPAAARTRPAPPPFCPRPDAAISSPHSGIVALPHGVMPASSPSPRGCRSSECRPRSGCEPAPFVGAVPAFAGVAPALMSPSSAAGARRPSCGSDPGRWRGSGGRRGSARPRVPPLAPTGIDAGRPVHVHTPRHAGARGLPGGIRPRSSNPGEKGVPASIAWPPLEPCTGGPAADRSSSLRAVVVPREYASHLSATAGRRRPLAAFAARSGMLSIGSGASAPSTGGAWPWPPLRPAPGAFQQESSRARSPRAIP